MGAGTILILGVRSVDDQRDIVMAFTRLEGF
jgi:hypothetical protein